MAIVETNLDPTFYQAANTIVEREIDIRMFLKQWRIMAGLSIYQAAALLCQSPSTISKVENSKQGIQVEEFFRWLYLYQNVRHVATFTVS